MNILFFLVISFFTILTQANSDLEYVQFSRIFRQAENVKPFLPDFCFENVDDKQVSNLKESLESTWKVAQEGFLATYSGDPTLYLKISPMLQALLESDLYITGLQNCFGQGKKAEFFSKVYTLTYILLDYSGHLSGVASQIFIYKGTSSLVEKTLILIKNNKVTKILKMILKWGSLTVTALFASAIAYTASTFDNSNLTQIYLDSGEIVEARKQLSEINQKNK